MTTIAEKFNVMFEAFGRDERGRVDGDVWAILNVFPRDIETTCPESHDSTIIVTFSDGSRVVIDNPDQAAFAAHCDVITE